eukprot:8402706-Pyramimonas_sp.AAC.1
MAKLFSDAFVGGLRGGDAEKVLVVYDNEQAGESAAFPRIRMPSFKTDRLEKMIPQPAADPPVPP